MHELTLLVGCFIAAMLFVLAATKAEQREDELEPECESRM